MFRKHDRKWWRQYVSCKKATRFAVTTSKQTVLVSLQGVITWDHWNAGLNSKFFAELKCCKKCTHKINMHCIYNYCTSKHIHFWKICLYSCQLRCCYTIQNPPSSFKSIGAFPLQRGVRFKRAVPSPFLVAFPLGVVPASGYYFTVFLAPQNRGS